MPEPSTPGSSPGCGGTVLPATGASAGRGKSGMTLFTRRATSPVCPICCKTLTRNRQRLPLTCSTVWAKSIPPSASRVRCRRSSRSKIGRIRRPIPPRRSARGSSAATSRGPARTAGSPPSSAGRSPPASPTPEKACRLATSFLRGLPGIFFCDCHQ